MVSLYFQKFLENIQFIEFYYTLELMSTLSINNTFVVKLYDTIEHFLVFIFFLLFHLVFHQTNIDLLSFIVS